MQKGLDSMEGLAALCGNVTTRPPARRDHLHSSDQCMEKELDSLKLSQLFELMPRLQTN